MSGRLRRLRSSAWRSVGTSRLLFLVGGLLVAGWVDSFLVERANEADAPYWDVVRAASARTVRHLPGGGVLSEQVAQGPTRGRP